MSNVASVKQKSWLTAAETKKFFDAIQSAKNQDDPDSVTQFAVLDMLQSAMTNAYVKNVRKSDACEVTRSLPHHTDGLITVSPQQTSMFADMLESECRMREFSILIEVKKDPVFTGECGRSNRAKVLAQVVYYLKDFQIAGDPIPNVVVVADMNEIFPIATHFLMPYLSQPYDWSITPSLAAEQNFELYQALCTDNNINPYVEVLDRETFSPAAFAERVASLAINSGNFSKIRVESHTMEKAFVEFQRTVLGGQVSDTKKQMQIFVKSLLGDDNIFVQPNRKNELCIMYKDGKGRDQIETYPHNCDAMFSSAKYEQFFSKYDRSKYTLNEKKAITEIADTLFDEFDRRFTGDFWTPKNWVDEAHKLIEEQLGLDWKEKYVVWDPACGSKNLTRDYKFSELYCSTLHQDELNIAEDYNREGVSFQYDFLNTDIDSDADSNEWRIPDGLLDALRNNKPIVFLANPPYGQATGGQGKAHKAGVANTLVGDLMQKEGIRGIASKELYTQFIYRIQQLAKRFNYTQDFFFFLFFNKGFLTTQSFTPFTNNLFNEFKFRDGFMFNAGEFQGTSSSWGIIFSGWEIGKSKENYPNPKFKVFGTKTNNGVKEIKHITDWTAKKTPEYVIDEMCRFKLNERLTNFPTTSNGFTPSKSTKPQSSYTANSFGYLQAFASSIQKSMVDLAFFSMANYMAHGTPITVNNFVSASVVFSVRKAWNDIISQQKLLWVRDKDVFPAPSKDFQSSESWNEFSNDCVVYSLFASGSNQTSLRDYEYGTEADGSPKFWRVENQFFWLDKEKIRELSQQHNMVQIEKDLDTDEQRYVFNYLDERKDGLSEEAVNLLDVATHILEKSFKYRVVFNEEQPKYNLLSWDAGWEQVRRMCYAKDASIHAKNDKELQELYVEFKEARKTLGDKIAYRYSEDTGF